MTKKDHTKKSSAISWICNKVYEENEMRVKDHDHITGKYWKSVHQECNINLSLIEKNPYCVS